MKSAVANATQKSENIDVDNLFVEQCFINEGPRLKRHTARAYGPGVSLSTADCAHHSRAWREGIMGQKTHPYGFRLGITKPWRSRWFAKRDYSRLLHEDLKLKRDLKKQLGHAGVSNIEVERMANKLRITIYTSRPGIIIGRKGRRDRQAQGRCSEENESRGLHQYSGNSPARTGRTARG